MNGGFGFESAGIPYANEESNPAFVLEELRLVLGAEASLWMDEELTVEAIEAAERVKALDTPEVRFGRFIIAHDIAAAGLRRIRHSVEFTFAVSSLPDPDKHVNGEVIVTQVAQIRRLRIGFAEEAAANAPDIKNDNMAT